MPDDLTADERAAIAAYPESRIQRIPRKVSGLPQYRWVANAKGEHGKLVADRPTGWRVIADAMLSRATTPRGSQTEKFRQARQKANDRARAVREERFPKVIEMARQGLPTSAIAAQIGLAPKTIADDLRLLRERGQL